MAMVVAMSGFVSCGLILLVPAVIVLVLKGFERAAQAKMHRFRATTDCGGVAPGPVELKGRVSSKATVAPVLTDKPAVYHKTVIQDGRNGDWRTTVDDEKMTLFYVEDDSGRVRVDPRGAEFHVSDSVSETVKAGESRFKIGPEPRQEVNQRRFNENVLAVGDEVYVLGHARENRELAVPEIRAEKDQPFVISDHDESHLIHRHQRAATLYLINAYFLALPVPATLTAIFQGIPLVEALEVAILPTFALAIGMPVVLWGIYRLNHHHHLETLKDQVQEGRRILRQECKHREELVDQLMDEVLERVDTWTIRARLQDLREDRKKSASAIARMRSNEELGRVVDRQSEVLDRIFAAIESQGLVQELASDASMVSLMEELTRSEHRLVMGRNFINDGLERLWSFIDGESGFGSPSTQGQLEFGAFERKPIEVILDEDPDSLYSGDVDAEERRAEVVEPEERREEAAPQVAVEEEEGPSEERDRQEDWDFEPVVPDGDQIEKTASSTGVEAGQEEGEWPGQWPDLEPISASMRFGGAAESAFGDIGRFGEARDFGSLTKSDGLEERARRKAFGFTSEEMKWGGKASLEKARQGGRKSEDFGFSDEEKKGVLAAFEDGE